MNRELDTTDKRLTVLIGIDTDAGTEFVREANVFASVDLGWIDFTFGQDVWSSPVVFAIASGNTFLLSVHLPPDAATRESEPHSPWVFAVADLSTGLTGALRAAGIEFAGYLIEHGVDSCGSNYLSLTMPNEQMHLLFRDPATPSTLGKGDSAHIGVTEGMEIGDFDGAIALVRIQAEDAQRAAVIDALMDRLISPFPPCDASPCVTDE